jgi:PST family polysaccharide transporter
MTRTLRNSTASGLRWTAMSQAAKQVMNVFVSLVLARLTGPGAYGLIGIVTIMTGFAALFVDLGLGSGLVQRAHLQEEHVSAVFWVNVLAGAVLAALMAVCAPLVAEFYGEPSITMIMRVTSLGFALGAVGTVQNALLTRQMRFRELAAIDITATAVSGLLGVAAALAGFGVWSLVTQTLAQACMRTAGLWYRSPWRPRTAPRFAGIQGLAHFSGNLFVYNVFNYWVRNLDNVLIGRYVGAFALGLYSRAYQLMLLPVQQIAGVSGNVLFPAMSSVQHDRVRVRSIYLRSISAMHLVAAPVYAGLFAVADTFVLAVLGAPWLPMVPLLRILCIIGFWQPVGSSTGWIYMALGRTDVMMKWGVFTGVLYVAGFYVGLKWGLIGVTWSYCIAGVIAWYPGWAIAGKLVDITFGDMVRPLLPSSACAVAMAGLVWLIGSALKPITATLVLGIQVLGGAVFYALLVLLLRLKSWQHVRSLID